MLNLGCVFPGVLAPSGRRGEFSQPRLQLLAEDCGLSFMSCGEMDFDDKLDGNFPKELIATAPSLMCKGSG